MNTRCRLPDWESREMTAEQAASLIQDGMVVGTSGFTRAGEAKEVPLALARRTRTEPLQITLMTGASLGNDIDANLVESNAVSRRLPFQVDRVMRKAINEGRVLFTDIHLSEVVEQLRNRQLPAVDIAIIEAVAITEEGGIVPSASVGNSATFAQLADKVIVELNESWPSALEGLHDIYLPEMRPNRTPVDVVAPDTRIGTPYIQVPPEKIVAIVRTSRPDSPSNNTPADDETRQIASHLVNFLSEEVRQNRLPPELFPIQAGIGTMANAVLEGLADSSFKGLTMYSEVLQDSAFDLLDKGTLRFASASSITLTKACGDRVWPNIESYKDRLILRPQEISNLPEIVRRLGIIAINTALEIDIYGNVNSTHVAGTRMMNGIGGSGDFARNGNLSIFITKSLAKHGDISSIVPFVSHVDHCEHDVDIIVTEHGLADLRGRSPRERSRLIIENCADPLYQPALNRYIEEAEKRGGHTPHCLEKALSWHVALEQEGSMTSIR
ncbi:Succinyl-CoA:coenzyme A transferase [Halomonadaceae bacterium LMG 33818]|uniref:acetyl-CoA hydrolase/transferase family protein n=1 Tax=Cernens ardua TaxID=3402176 RepID=UPI003EDBF793